MTPQNCRCIIIIIIITIIFVRSRTDRSQLNSSHGAKQQKLIVKTNSKSGHALLTATQPGQQS